MEELDVNRAPAHKVVGVDMGKENVTHSSKRNEQKTKATTRGVDNGELEVSIFFFLCVEVGE
jgi:hypothetical protein